MRGVCRQASFGECAAHVTKADAPGVWRVWVIAPAGVGCSLMDDGACRCEVVDVLKSMAGLSSVRVAFASRQVMNILLAQTNLWAHGLTLRLASMKCSGMCTKAD